jgi:hypothetical protein
MKRSATIYLLPLFFLLIALLIGQKFLRLEKASAVTMTGDNYILQMGTLDSFSGQASGGDKELNFTGGQSPQGLSGGSKNKVKLGFQYIHPLRGFSFSISQSLIDFGILSPTNPVIRNAILTVNNRSGEGYTVSASENHPLQSAASGQTIPDTTCDNGACTQLVSGIWENALTYGFGYRCDPISDRDCADGFANNQSYKQFADESKNEAPQTVMLSSSNGGTKQVKITYKVNISGTQPAGAYANTITFIAVPSF